MSNSISCTKKIQIYDSYLYLLFIWIQILQLCFIKKKIQLCTYTRNFFFLSTHLYLNVWSLSIFVIYLNSNTSIMFIKEKKKIQIKTTTSHVQEEKKKISIMYIYKEKKGFSLHPFVLKCLIPICICYLFEFKYFNYLYLKKKNKLLLPKK